MTRILTAAGAGLALGLLTLTASGAARANVVTFDGGTLQTFPGLLSGTYIENGLQFDIYGDAPDFIADNHGGHALQIHLNNDILIHPVAGGTFSLTSFTFLGGGDTEFAGYAVHPLSGGAIGADVSIGLTGLAATVHPLADNPLWGHVTGVDWCGYCISGFVPDNAIDNVTFDLPAVSRGVPEPASWALLILGFGGAGAMLRRRRWARA